MLLSTLSVDNSCACHVISLSFMFRVIGTTLPLSHFTTLDSTVSNMDMTSIKVHCMGSIMAKLPLVC